MRSFVAVLISIGALLVAFMCWQVFQFTLTGAGDDETPVIFDVAPGASLNGAAARLEQQGLIRDAFKFRLFARFIYGSSSIKIGEYSLNSTMSPRRILDILTKGQSIQYSLTIPEGYNMFEIKDLLNSRWPGRGDKFLEIVTDKKFVESVLKEKRSSLEGYLFPDTYLITKYTDGRWRQRSGCGSNGVVRTRCSLWIGDSLLFFLANLPPCNSQFV